MSTYSPHIAFYKTCTFGSPLIGRTYQAETSVKYRYSFNGKEKDDEIYGKGNSTTAMYWEYDTRLGRRWNEDIVFKPNLSNYSTFSNNPIWLVDPNGDDWFVNDLGYYIWSTGTTRMNQGNFQYVGTDLPANVKKCEILMEINGKLYYKHSKDYFAVAMNNLSKAFGGDGDHIENKEWSRHDAMMATEFQGIAVGWAAFKAAGIAFKVFSKAGGSIWKMVSGTQRGFIYETMRGGNLVKNYPVIDKFVEGVATSIKTLDFRLPSYKNPAKVYSTLKGYVDKLSTFEGANVGGVKTLGQIQKKVLDVGVPKGASKEVVAMFQKIVEYGKKNNVEVIINTVK